MGGRGGYWWGVWGGIWGVVVCEVGVVFGLEGGGGWMENRRRCVGMKRGVNGCGVWVEGWEGG